MNHLTFCGAALFSTLVAGSLLLSACQSPPSATTPDIGADIHAEEQPVITTLTVNTVATEAETGWPIGQRWLTLHADRGIQLYDAQTATSLTTTPLTTTPLTTEYGDRRGQRFVTWDILGSRLLSFSMSENGIGDLMASAPVAVSPEGLCLYQPEGEPLQVFLLGEDQLAHQMIIQDQGQALELIPVRTLPLPPGTEYCAASDTHQQLFISEEDVGVWALPASAEKQLKRMPVDLSAPWGNLADGPGPLAIVGDQLLVAGVGSHSLQAYRSEADGFSVGQHWQLPDDLAIETLTAVPTASGARLTMFDDATGKLISTDVSLPSIPRQGPSLPQVMPVAETTPVATGGDAADDPAIWINPQNAKDSRILGTNKKSGLAVYNLNGQQLQFLPAGRVNNVDVRQGFILNNQATDIAAASQRDRQAISLFAISPDSGRVMAAGEIATSLDNVYGLCMYMNLSQQVYVFINDEDGRFQQYRIDNGQNGWQGELVREFAVGSQPEGCVADDVQGMLYLGEENRAVWKIPAEPESTSEPGLMVEVSDTLVADIEGMGLYRTEKSTLLIVSSQGNDSYVVYDTKAPYRTLGRFRVSMNAEAGIDGASETDGLEVTSTPLGSRFPQGLLVVQDGRNVMPAENQNFKLVSWEDVAARF